MTDAPGLANRFNPHFYYLLSHRDGRSTLKFALRAEATAEMYVEWRDGATPYRVGPSVWLQNGKLLLTGGKPLLDLPAGQWVRFEMTVGLGQTATGTWNLAVTLPGQEPRRFDQLPCVSADWKTLEWLGFVSNANGKTAFWLDDIELGNVAGTR